MQLFACIFVFFHFNPRPLGAEQVLKPVFNPLRLKLAVKISITQGLEFGQGFFKLTDFRRALFTKVPKKYIIQKYSCSKTALERCPSGLRYILGRDA